MLPQPIKNFIDLFAKFPGIGPRQSSRIAFWLVRQGPAKIAALRNSMEDLERNVKICRQCFFVYAPGRSDDGLCDICRDPKRDQKTLAVVEKETDLVTIEKTRRFRGLYHILGGVLLPLSKTSEQDEKIVKLRLRALEERLKNRNFEEVILALSPTTAGDYTAQEVARILKSSGLKITRLAMGLPRGAEIEFTDEDTMVSALEGRK